ncbi:MAG: hypothetical protein SPL61_12055 [Saccharofermentans sp.]|nr:hypothetical protein [Saccharofermentans sp.]
MSLRRIILMIGAILSGVAVFVPMYMIQVDHQTVRDGVVNIMSSPIYAIIILCADLVIIGGAIVGLKKAYVISSLISIGVSGSALWNFMINQEASKAIVGMTGSLLNSLGGANYNYTIEDGPAMIIMIIAMVVILFSMLWCAFAEE